MRDLDKDIDSWELTSANSNCTGLPMNVWFQCNSRKLDLRPMLLVQMNNSKDLNVDQIVKVTIEDNPAIITVNSNPDLDLTAVKNFIILNQEAILAHWNCESDSYELLKSLKQVG